MNIFEWKNKKILITGADGFMGSHLTEKLLGLGADVSVYIRSNSMVTSQLLMRNINHLKGRIKHVLAGDIASHDAVSLIKKSNADYIFHLAADAYVNKSFEQPLEVNKTNVDGTLNVLHAAMEMDVEQLVCTSSSEIYGTQNKAITENTPFYPSSPYAASKVAADRYCFSYWNTFNIPVSIIRPFNTYGPRHTYDVIPKFIDLALKGESLPIYGEGKQTRDFSYVDDTIRGFLIMASNPKAIGKAVNFGSGRDYTINEIARLIVDISGSKSKIIHVKQRMSEVDKLLCDYSYANKLFGFKPEVSLKEGLKRNIEYEKKKRGI